MGEEGLVHDEDLIRHLDSEGNVSREVLETHPIQPASEHNPHDRGHHETSNLRDPLYKDKYVQIFSDRVEIFKYFFPLATSKVILMNDISRVDSDKELKLPALHYKGWGMGVTNIWWAMDYSRENIRKVFNNDKGNTCLIFEVQGSSFRKGCSVENPSAALAVLRQFVHN